MAKYTDEQIKKALDILAKFDFFQGQRAGRELWFDKPTDIQNEDITNFSKDVAFLKDLIKRQEAEIERLKEKNRLACQCTPKAIRRARAEAIKEFAERIDKILCLQISPSKRLFWKIKADIDNLVKEMVGEGE